MNRPVVIDAVSDMYAIANKPWTPSGAAGLSFVPESPGLTFQTEAIDERRDQADPACGDRQRRATDAPACCSTARRRT